MGAPVATTLAGGRGGSGPQRRGSPVVATATTTAAATAFSAPGGITDVLSTITQPINWDSMTKTQRRNWQRRHPR
eukprot:CAMPEP_0171649370 /NCGR_PEP_ID=MMETSP0990-20121206/36750_1 /TAXON_ID=483369 /ORGANISM="non described non described, Strain CCMP2098" /LENGTH=74 /DNA_ID=CAMNT_0012227249 /DNA_START=287 /DNA_END=511 /DNA_ORIENTATION=+